MTRIVVDESLSIKLPMLMQPVELCDAQGNVLGKYYPSIDPADHHLEPQISNEEINRRKQNKGKTYTTAEVIAHLESL